MQYPHLTEVILLKRYKRFLVDVQLEDGEVLTVHCPNPGSMKNCFEPGWKGFLSKSNNPKRKLSFTLELVHNGESFIGVNPVKANDIVYEALLNNKIKELSGLSGLKREVKYGKEKHSRVDIWGCDGETEIFIEVKSVSMLVNQWCAFPDAITQRGQKHIDELLSEIKKSHRACLFFLVARQDGLGFKPAWDIDKVYCEKLHQAVFNGGLEVYAYEAIINNKRIEVGKKLSISWTGGE